MGHAKGLLEQCVGVLLWKAGAELEKGQAKKLDCQMDLGAEV